jgi:metallo-beta-lactamase family protein
VQPLYDENDVQATVACLQACPFGRSVPLAPGITAVFHEAGHIPGAASVLIEVRAGGDRSRILFSGDVGREHRPLVNDPEAPAEADVVLVESTYGDRLHGPDEDIQGRLASVISETAGRGGKVLVPSFAIGRAQEMIWRIDQLIRERRIPRLPVLLDSPMAIKLMEVLKRHPEALDAQMRGAMARGESPFAMPNLKLLASREDSKSANTMPGAAVIIAGAGMCTGGRIKHHLDQHLENPANTVLFIGYQAAGTLGRLLVDGVKQVRLFGRQRAVRAQVVQVHGFSGHADREELLAWLAKLPAPPKQVYIIHGGANVSQGFAALVRERLGWQASAPDFQQQVILDSRAPGI